MTDYSKPHSIVFCNWKHQKLGGKKHCKCHQPEDYPIHIKTEGGIIPEKSGRDRQTPASDSPAPTPSPVGTDWEQEFDKEFDGELWVKGPSTDWVKYNEGASGDYYELKSFIRDLLTQERAAVRAERVGTQTFKVVTKKNNDCSCVYSMDGKMLGKCLRCVKMESAAQERLEKRILEWAELYSFSDDWGDMVIDLKKLRYYLSDPESK